jgi:hypothetical protein
MNKYEFLCRWRQKSKQKDFHVKPIIVILSRYFKKSKNAQRIDV